MQHLKRGPVFIYSRLIKQKPKFKKLTDYIDVEEAKIKENDFVNEYKNSGWQVLNSATPGAIGGGTRKWTKEKCIEDAKQYSRKCDYINSKGYKAAFRNEWLTEVYQEAGFKISTNKPFKYWTKERCIMESEKYETFKEFCKQSRVTYSLCQRHKWVIEIKKYRNW
jgi:hypothetical protein